jgi:uncharacterized protein (TIGR02265 family)
MTDSARTGKAAGFTTMIELLRDRLGAARFGAVQAALSPETRALIQTPPLATTWHEIRPWFELLEVAERVGFGGRTEAMAELGRAQMHRDMNTIYKVFIRLASAESIIKRAAAIYSTYTTNGAMSAHRRAPRECEVRMRDVHYATPGFWAFQRGCLTGVLEVAGVKGSTCEIQSGGGTSTECLFVVRWR